MKPSELSYEEIIIAWSEEIQGYEILSERDCELLAGYERCRGYNVYVPPRPLYVRVTTGPQRGMVVTASFPSLNQCLEWAWSHGLSVTMTPLPDQVGLDGTIYQVAVINSSYQGQTEAHAMTCVVGLCEVQDHVVNLLAEALIKHRRRVELYKSEKVLCACGHPRSLHEESNQRDMWLNCRDENCSCDVFFPAEA